MTFRLKKMFRCFRPSPSADLKMSVAWPAEWDSTESPVPQIDPPSDAALFEFRGISKTYREADGGVVRVLSDFSAQIPADGLTALVGENGTGKTTLVNLATGMDTNYTGAILHRGSLIPGHEGPELRNHRRTVAYVGQQFNNVPHLSALDNVALTRFCQGWSMTDAREAAGEALRAVGIAQFAHRLPHKLSGGQQRVAIARALASGAATIVADEPSGNLDPRTRDQIMELFHLCCGQRRSVVMITHSMELAHRCDRVFRLRPNGLVPVEHVTGAAHPTRLVPQGGGPTYVLKLSRAARTG